MSPGEGRQNCPQLGATSALGLYIPGNTVIGLHEEAARAHNRSQHWREQGEASGSLPHRGPDLSERYRMFLVPKLKLLNVYHQLEQTEARGTKITGGWKQNKTEQNTQAEAKAYTSEKEFWK